MTPPLLALNSPEGQALIHGKGWKPRASEYVREEKPLPAPRGRTVRHTPGEMNESEKRYAKRLEDRRIAGDIAWWGYECWKVKLADRSWYTPDFAVMLADGTLELHELKGFMESDAAVKLRVTSAFYWMFRVRLVKEKPKGVFTLTEVGR